jgi:hypothetical protein
MDTTSTTDATSTNKRHEVVEWHHGFDELVAGKPFDVRKDDGYQPGDLLIVREHRYGKITGRVALFHIHSVARGSDHRGAYEALIPAGVVVLGLIPSNLVTEETSGPVRLVNRKDSRAAA